MRHRQVVPLQDYVKAKEGKRVIDKILVANNGIAAVKAMTSMRQWAYETLGDTDALCFVAMATPEDLKVNAEYIKMADMYEEVPGGANFNNFANVDVIVEVAERCGAQAVWAGWGHASEYPQLPDALAAAGITFLGPPSGPMRDLGDKIGSTIIAQSAKVPTVPWSGSHLHVNYADAGGVPDDVYQQATVSTLEEVFTALESIGYPAMIKASEGGGGKGIRKVESVDQVEAAFRQVQGEVAGSPIFIMKMVRDARHLEVQVLADEHGSAISIYGRDCSVQRRHQKIIEEGPVIVTPPAVWAEMERAAVRLTSTVGYVGAGTIEYLYKDGEFFFLELNPRLQVEHPVTEQLSGVNLPACQLLVGMGIPLANIPDIRQLYGLEPNDVAPIDFATTPQVQPKQHVIAVRLTAENPDKGFQPTNGTIRDLHFKSIPNVSGYFSVSSGGGLHEFADSQFGHLFARGQSRDECVSAMVLSLKQVSIRGDINTTVEYLVHLMETPDYRQNHIHTAWLDGLIRDQSLTPGSDLTAVQTLEVVLCGAVYQVYEAILARSTKFTDFVNRGQIPSVDLLSTKDELDLIFNDIKYTITVSCTGPTSFLIELGDDEVHAEVRPFTDGGTLILVNGKSHVCYGTHDANGLRLMVNGKMRVFPKENDPTQLVASTSGKLVKYLVPNGEHVVAGTAYAEIEIMKMFLPLVVEADGRLHRVLPEGSVMATGDLIARLEVDDPSQLRKAKPFAGSVPGMLPPTSTKPKVHQRMREAQSALNRVLSGYAARDAVNAARHLLQLVRDPRLPLAEFSECLAVHHARVPKPLLDRIVAILDVHERQLCAVPNMPLTPNQSNVSLSGTFACEGAPAFPAQGLSGAIASYLAEHGHGPDSALTLTLQPLASLAQLLDGGTEGYERRVVGSLLRDYLVVESLFQHRTKESVWLNLRTVEPSEGVGAGAMVSGNAAEAADHIYSTALSHHNLRAKNDLVRVLITHIMESNTVAPYTDLLRRMSALKAKGHMRVALRAREALMLASRPSVSQRQAGLDAALRRVLHISDDPVFRAAAMERLANSQFEQFDVLIRCCSHEDPVMALAAMEVYLRRCFVTYCVRDVSPGPQAATGNSGPLSLQWYFSDAVAAAGGDAGPGMDGDGPGGILDDDSESSDVLGPASPEPIPHTLHGDNSDSSAPPSPLEQPAMQGGLGRASMRSSDLNLVQAEMAARQSLASSTASGSSGQPAQRFGMMTMFPQLGDLMQGFGTVLASYQPGASCNRNILEVLITNNSAAPSADDLAALQDLLFQHRSQLEELCITRVTVALGMANQYPLYYTFRRRLGYAEDLIYRHMEPPLAYHLELHRLSRYDIDMCPLESSRVHIYAATQKEGPIVDKRRGPNRRLFVRALVREPDVHSSRTGGGSGTAASLASVVAIARGGGGGTGDASSLQQARRGRDAADPSESSASGGPMSFLVGGVPGNAMLSSTTAFATTSGGASTAGDATSGGGSGGGRRASSGSAVDGSTTTPSSAASAAPSKKGVAPMSSEAMEGILEEAESVMIEALDALELVSADRQGYHNHHIFVKVMPEVPLDPAALHEYVVHFGHRFGHRLWQLNVSEFELSMRCVGASPPLRLVISNPSSFRFHVDPYMEVRNAATGTVCLNSVGPTPGPLHGTVGGLPYQVPPLVAIKRWLARSLGTTYVYDLGDIFHVALEHLWAKALEHGQAKHVPTLPLFSWVELVLNATGDALEQTKRDPCCNDVGMVAWLATLRTPEYPNGREVIIIANDITHQGGSFGLGEDAVFHLASSMARAKGLPRLYIAANSGARIGMAEEVRSAFRIAWKDPTDPDQGVDHLYLSDADAQVLRAQGSVRAFRVGPDHWRITDIIGCQDGIGVENLRGSGLIAGETSAAYEETWTATLVTGRAVGIGSYLARLGQRVVQNKAPIILTGAPALNQVLGRQVYISNAQIGGPDIMYRNGVSHADVNDDLRGVAEMLRWMAFVPARQCEPAAVLPSLADPVNRDVEWCPLGASGYDPRHLLAGAPDPNTGRWLSGFFDRGSWNEILAGWARSVVVGRARLGGMPVAVIAVETRTTEMVCPADPARADSQERIVQQAGQVWYPDSAQKTAQAIRDFDHGEQLPLIIFANWRGFSGGLRDMYDEVLKFGAQIVDSLRAYRQPVMVYIPPLAELRGGAWAVLDPSINPDHMEMYASVRAQAGILEPAGTVEIKYRERSLRATMHRLDESLAARVEDGAEPGDAGVAKREAELMAAYKQAALLFAKLHDTSGRMKAKGVIREVVEWTQSRRFFYHRIRRLQHEHRIVARLQAVHPGLSRDEARAEVRSACGMGHAAVGDALLWADDARVADWMEGNQQTLDGLVQLVRQRWVHEQVAHVMASPKDLTSWVAALQPDQLTYLHRVIGDKIAEQ